jgi:transcriptional regulator with XRE-family HTH domain
MPAPSPRYARDPVLVASGKAVRRIRLERQVLQEELACLSGIDRSYMSSIERGGQNLGPNDNCSDCARTARTGRRTDA